MLAPWIISHMPEHRVYVEPYGGGCNVLLRKPRCYAEVYNDLDQEVVNVFRMVRDRGPELAEALRLTPFAREEFFDAYEPTENALEAARRTIIKSFMGFGSDSIRNKSGFRNNAHRSGSTPAHDWARYPDRLAGAISRLSGVIIENKDALELMSQMDGPETLHYVDPPYVHETRTSALRYAFEMTDAQHREMAACLRGLSGMVMVAGYPSPLYDELFSDWNRIERAALADGARPRTEVMWTNFQQQDRLL